MEEGGRGDEWKSEYGMLVFHLKEISDWKMEKIPKLSDSYNEVFNKKEVFLNATRHSPAAFIMALVTGADSLAQEFSEECFSRADGPGQATAWDISGRHRDGFCDSVSFLVEHWGGQRGVPGTGRALPNPAACGMLEKAKSFRRSSAPAHKSDK